MTAAYHLVFFSPYLCAKKTGPKGADCQLKIRPQLMHIPRRNTAVSEIVRGICWKGNHASRGRPHLQLTLRSQTATCSLELFPKLIGIFYQNFNITIGGVISYADGDNFRIDRCDEAPFIVIRVVA